MYILDTARLLYRPNHTGTYRYRYRYIREGADATCISSLTSRPAVALVMTRDYSIVIRLRSYRSLCRESFAVFQGTGPWQFQHPTVLEAHHSAVS